MQQDILENIKTLLPSIFDDSKDAVIVVGIDDAVAYVNVVFLQAVALTSEKIKGKQFADIGINNAALSSYKNAVHQVVSSKEAVTCSREINATSSLHEFITASPIMSAKQSVLGVILIAKQAVVDQPAVDQALRRSEVYQNAIINSLTSMIWLKDKEGKLLVTNNAYAEMAGVDGPKALEGKTDFDLWPTELAQGYVEDDLKVLSSGESTTLVEQIKNTHGQMYWAETYKAPVIVDDEVIGTVGFARDVTEQKALLTAITKKELEYDSLVKNLPLAIVRYDQKGRRVFVNVPKHNAEATSDDIQYLLGKTPLELWDPNVKNMTAEEYQDKLMHVLLHGEAQTFEMHCEVSGVTYVNMVNIMPEFDENNYVVGALALANDVTEISKYRHDLEYLAFHDALTALPNRVLLNQQLREAAANGDRFGLMFMDLDFFKAINDTLGHAVGDGLLVDVAKRITAAVRGDDVVARIGGDEFAILVTNLKDDADLGGLAAKVANQLSAPFDIEGISFFVTASIGIACYPNDSEDVDDLMKYADTAMYDAKQQGRNNYQYYTPELTQQAVEHLAIATALRYAIKKNELFLLHQPKVDIGSGEITGVEMLLRWHGKVLGQIMPDKFIPIAEESGLIVDIGAWVLNASCEMAVQLNHHREAPLNIAVNVSSREFIGNNNYIENLQGCLQKTGCKAEWLTLEITESLLLQDSGTVLKTLVDIDAMGITLAIDDFGTGYSALSYLSKFPIKQVKIDRSFVMDICNSQTAASLIRAIIAMALSLDKELVAEGIETQAQASLIQEYGCHQAQGYFYSKPIPFAALMHMLQQQKNH